MTDACRPPLDADGPHSAPRMSSRRLPDSRWLRTALTSAFVLLMLGSAHLFMVVINAAERGVTGPMAELGAPARMFGDQSLEQELEAAVARTRAPADREILQRALVQTRAGDPPELRVLPVTRFVVFVSVGLSALGLFLVWLTSRVKSDVGQSILGIFGGNLLWTGAIEYALTAASRGLGVGKTVAVLDGRLVAVYGEYVLLKHTWGALALVLAYLMFLESSRCPVFLWWRRKVPTMRGALVSGRIENYGPRSAFQYATTVWFFYLLLLWAYDEGVAGVHSLATTAILFAALAGSVYCVVRLHEQPSWGASVRYAVGAMIVVWTPIEILGKWGVMQQPWLLLEPTTAAIFFGGLGLGTWALWRAARRRRAASHVQSMPSTLATA